MSIEAAIGLAAAVGLPVFFVGVFFGMKLERDSIAEELEQHLRETQP